MNVSVRDLLDAGVHFGHQTRRWNPRSKPYIYAHRQGVSIIDLAKTHEALARACEFATEHVANGGSILFVGTKRQAQDILREAGNATGMPFSVNRWLGGTLTNFQTIKRSIAKYKKWQQMDTDGELAKLPKKEESKIRREMARMQRNFDGITEMTDVPGAMFVVDIKHEEIAVAEGRRLELPIIAIVDTNSDPALVSHPIPANDDAVKSIRVIVDAIVEAIQNGLAQRETRRIARPAQESRGAAAAIPASVDLSHVEIPKSIKGLEDLEEETVIDEPVAIDSAAAEDVTDEKPN